MKCGYSGAISSELDFRHGSCVCFPTVPLSGKNFGHVVRTYNASVTNAAV